MGFDEPPTVYQLIGNCPEALNLLINDLAAFVCVVPR